MVKSKPIENVKKDRDMFSKKEKRKMNKSRAIANSVAQMKSNGMQGLQFVDNRPLAKQTTQLKAMLKSCEHSSPRLPVTQLAPKRTKEQGGKGSTYYSVVYQDEVQNFSDGADAGESGLWPVGNASLIGHYHDGKAWKDAGEAEINQGVVEYYFCGHMLAKSLGGQGGADNIFAQDTNNNIGKWVSAEDAIRKESSAQEKINPKSAFRVGIHLSGRDGSKLQQKKIKGEKLDIVTNDETKKAAKMREDLFS